MSTVSSDGAASVAASSRAIYPLPKRTMLSVAVIFFAGVVALLAVMATWHIGVFESPVATTDNAYVHGRTTVLAPQVSGYVVAVHARDFEHVTAQQPLVVIDSRTYAAQVDQAQATVQSQIATLRNLDQAHASRLASARSSQAAIENSNAQVLRAKADLRRVDDLVSDGSVSLREQDQQRAALAQANAQLRQAEAARDIALEDVRSVEVSRDGVRAQIEAAQAQLKKARIDLENTQVLAPEAGQVGEVGVRLGQYVTNGTSLLSLVPSDRWVIANFKESQTNGMSPGQRAWVTVDALGGQRFEGHVEQLAPATGSEFSVVKPDNGTGNFVKIPQRIGVRIALDGEASALARLRPGMSVEANVDTSRHAHQ